MDASVPNRLTCKYLESLLDDEIQRVLFQFAGRVHRQDGATNRERYAVFKSLPKPLQFACVTRALEHVMNSSGFIEYFVSGEGQLALEPIQGFKVLHDDDCAGVVERAVQRQ